MGFVDFLDNNVAIIAIAVLLRFGQGAASAFVQTTCYSIAINDFPDNKESVIG